MSAAPYRQVRPGELTAFGAALGAVAWGCVGAWIAAHEVNYPWNQANPILYGASKGVLLGALAGLVAALFVRRWGRTRRRAVVTALAGGVLGGGLPGTVRALMGPPDAVLYFQEAMPAVEWYWSQLPPHWSGRTMLPAMACAATLALATWSLSRSAWQPRTGKILSGLCWAGIGLGLLVLPSVVGYDGTIEGNGQHVNDSALASLTAWLAGAFALVIGVVRTASGSLRGADR